MAATFGLAWAAGVCELVPQAATANTSPARKRLLFMAGSVGRRGAPAHRRPRGISLPRMGEGGERAGLYDRPEGMTPLRRWLARGFGLRARMTASYVLVTFAAVLIVEALATITLLPDVNQQADLANRAINTANEYVNQFVPAMGKAANVTASGVSLATLVDGQPLGSADAHLGPGEVRTADQGVVIPFVDQPLPDSKPMSLALVLDPNGLIFASSYPGRYSVGSYVTDRLPRTWRDGSSQVSKLRDGIVAWASQPILTLTPDSSSPKPRRTVLGYVYVQVPIPRTA